MTVKVDTEKFRLRGFLKAMVAAGEIEAKS